MRQARSASTAFNPSISTVGMAGYLPPIHPPVFCATKYQLHSEQNCIQPNDHTSSFSLELRKPVWYKQMPLHRASWKTLLVASGLELGAWWLKYQSADKDYVTGRSQQLKKPGSLLNLSNCHMILNLVAYNTLL